MLVSQIIIQDAQIQDIARSLFYAIIAALIYALSGYFKRTDPKEAFDGPTFITTLVIGAIAGFLSYFLTLTPEQAFAFVLSETGLVVIIENWAKAIWRRWIQPWFTTQQTAAATPPLAPAKPN
jgi:hypothetical protein